MQQTVVACSVVQQSNLIPAGGSFAFHVFGFLLQLDEFVKSGIGLTDLIGCVVAFELCSQRVRLLFLLAWRCLCPHTFGVHCCQNDDSSEDM